MNNTELEKIISDTQSNPYIIWNNSSLADWCRVDGEFSVYLFNRDGNHGYFSLLHNLTSKVDGIIVELGNREGLGILSIYDALQPDSKFYTLDIVNDNRFIKNEIKNDPRVNILNDFNSLDGDRVSKTFDKKSNIKDFSRLKFYKGDLRDHKFLEKVFINSQKKLLLVKNGDHSLSKKKWLDIIQKEIKLII